MLEIEGGTLKACDKSAKSVVIPKSVTAIDEKAFFECKALSSIKSESAAFAAQGGVLFDAKSKRLITTASGKVVIPAVIKTVSKYSLSNCTAVEFEKGGKIKTFPFLYSGTEFLCEDVRMALRDEVEKNKLKGKKSADVSASGADAILKNLVRKHFNWSKAIEVHSASDKTHRLCVLPKDKVRDFGLEIRLLDSRVSVWSKTLPAFLEKLGEGASFDELLKCAKENKLEVAGMNAFYYAVIDKKKIPIRSMNTASRPSTLSTVKFLDSVEEIGAAAFCGCKALSFVEIPSSVKKICASAFACCFDSLKGVRMNEGVEEIESAAFSHNHVLFASYIPKSIKKIGDCVFAGCRELSVVLFGGSVADWQKVEKGVFIFQGVPAEFIKCTDGVVKLSSCK